MCYNKNMSTILALDIGTEFVKAVLGELVKAGKIEKLGAGRSTTYLKR